MVETKWIPLMAATLFFFVIILQVPLFRSGLCKNFVWQLFHIILLIMSTVYSNRSGNLCVSCVIVAAADVLPSPSLSGKFIPSFLGQMAASDIMPPFVIKSFIYPGAVFHHLIRGDSLAPVWGNLLEEYNLTDTVEPVSEAYKFRLEVVAGCYFAVGGAVVSLIKPGRMSMFGLLLIIWGLLKDRIFGREENFGNDPANSIRVEPYAFFALALALLSIRYDMKKVKKLGAPIARPLRSSTKSKLKSK